MKKFLIALVAVIGLSVSARATDMHISVSYGGYTMMDNCDYHDHWHDVNTAWGALNFSFEAKIAPKLWIGPSYTFSSTSTSGPRSSKIAYHAIMMNGRYDYYRNRLLTMYAHLGLGVVVSHMMPRDNNSYNKTYFAMQASPLGVEVDLNRTFTLFGELGYGAQGLAQFGFRINL